MASASAVHDAAWGITLNVVEVFSPMLRDEERLEAVREVYPLVKAGLELYELKTERTLCRLAPTKEA